MTTGNIVMCETRLSIVDWGLFQVSDFDGDLKDPKLTSRGLLCIFGSRTFVLISWMCKKQTSVSHSSTASEILSFLGWTANGRITRSQFLGRGDRSIVLHKQYKNTN